QERSTNHAKKLLRRNEIRRQTRPSQQFMVEHRQDGRHIRLPENRCARRRVFGPEAWPCWWSPYRCNAPGSAEILRDIARRAKRCLSFTKGRKGGWSSGKGRPQSARYRATETDCRRLHCSEE